MLNEKSWYIFALLAAFFGALTTIFAKIGVENVNSNLATAIRTLVILAFAWGIVVANGQIDGLSTISLKSLFFLILSGLATGLSWLCYFRALQLGGASGVAAVDKSGVILVLLLSALFLSEPLSIRVGIGIVLVLAGTIVLAVTSS